tara:strand:- start:1507 stop:1800 length:294 start_codon:yes stop_codon:yes gene_type:complete
MIYTELLKANDSHRISKTNVFKPEKLNKALIAAHGYSHSLLHMAAWVFTSLVILASIFTASMAAGKMAVLMNIIFYLEIQFVKNCPRNTGRKRSIHE